MILFTKSMQIKNIFQTIILFGKSMQIKNVFQKMILFGKSMVSKPKLFSSSFDTSGTVSQEHLAENREVRSNILKSQSLPKDICKY